MYSPLLASDQKLKEQPFYISGKVHHSVTKKPLSDVSVLIWNTAVKVKTDTEGNFLIEIPTYFKGESAMFEVRFNGMESQIISLPATKNSENIVFYLEPKTQIKRNSVFHQMMKRMKIF
jgi:hypothetical protein